MSALYEIAYLFGYCLPMMIIAIIVFVLSTKGKNTKILMIIATIFVILSSIGNLTGGSGYYIGIFFNVLLVGFGWLKSFDVF